MQRRKFLQLAGFTALAPQFARARKRSGPLTVLTGFPQPMITRIQQAFQAAHPEIDLAMLRGSGPDAIARLRGVAGKNVDVYWAPSVNTFHSLAAEDRFAPLRVDRRTLPGRIGDQPQSDAADRFEASETAGYVLVVNKDYLAKRRLPIPTRFSDLSEPRYFGHIALPVPSSIGFAPALYEHWLQVYGWHPGLELLLAAAANARLETASGADITERVGAGDVGIGVSMDFFACNALAQGLPLSSHYPADTLFSPAHVAILKAAAHPEQARTFVDFLLSDSGQSLLLEPGISRLPVRSSAYRGAPQDTLNPFSMADQVAPNDLALRLRRAPIVSLLFDAAITDRHEQLRALWQGLNKAERDVSFDRKILAGARTLATRMPLSEQQARDASLAWLANRPTTKTTTRRDDLRREWGMFFERNYATALGLLG
jgi:phosphoglycerate transport regulatory protein PgtC